MSKTGIDWFVKKSKRLKVRLVQRIIRCKGSAHRYVVWVNGVARVVETSKKGCGFGLTELMKAFYGYLNPKEDYNSPLLTVEKPYLPPKKSVIQLEYLKDYKSPFLITEKAESSVIFISDYRLAKSIAASVLTVFTSSLFIEQGIALPTGAESVVGDIKFQTTGSTLDISTKSERAIARYNTFNIAQHETVNFNLPSRTSQILNFIGDQNPSQILGKLNSNGIVYLVNPNGLFFGQNAQVNVAGIVGSTLNINQNNYLNGNLIFEKNQSHLGKIENQGIINLQNNGAALFLGNQIENKGTITGNNAHIGLYSGNKITVGLDTTNSITADVSINTGTETSILNGINNTGTLSTVGGKINLQAKQQQNIYNQLINNSGVIEAKGISTNNGTIEILAENGAVTNTGILDVSNATGKGGTVHVLGDAIALDSNTLINANGRTGGGEILIGGDYQGDNPNIKNADFTYVGHNTQLKADATETGNGGKVIVWADDSTWYYGDISAKANQGDGGLAEVSGKETLYFYGSANLTSQHGERGTLLLDPDNIYIMSPTLWLDASQLTGYTNGQSVSSWTDMSGNGRTVTQGVVGNQPIYISNGVNGLPILRFDGVNDFMSGQNPIVAGSNYSIFLISKLADKPWDGNHTTSIQALVDNSHSGGVAGSGYVIQTRPDIGVGIMSFASLPLVSGSATSSTNIVNNTWRLYSAYHDGTFDKIGVDGNTTSNNSNNVSYVPGSSNLFVGKSDIFNRFAAADYAEIIFINQNLSTVEQGLVNQYLGNKYGISVPGASNTSVMTQSQIETLSQTANISLSATKDITIGKLNGGLLNLQGSASLTLTADSDLNGTGAVTMIDNTNTLRTTGGAISITGSRLALGNLDTRGVSGTLSGNIDLTALNNGISTGNIYTGGGTLTQTSASNFALNSVNTNGGAITLNALGNFYLFNPVLWLDANQLLGYQNASNVLSWSDLSGNNLNATQGVSSNSPIFQVNSLNDLPTLYFDGNDILSITDDPLLRPTTLSLFVVGNRTSGGNAWQSYVMKATNSGWGDGYGLYQNASSSTDNYFYVNNYSSSKAGGNIPFSTFSVLNGNYDLSNITLYNNGSLIQSSPNTVAINHSLQPFYVGSGTPNYYLTGYIGEVLLTGNAISTAERALVNQYLGTKYGISIPASGLTSLATQSQIQNLSLQGNVTINAKNDITVGKLNGGLLNLQGSASLTLTADSDLNGTGAVTMVDNTNTLRTTGGDINITGSKLSLGNLDTRGATGTLSGNINLSALTNGISAGNIYTGGGTLIQTSASNFALNSVNTNGGAITLNALGNFYLMAPSLWLDANQILGLVDGASVSTWNDLSGNGYNATQATGSMRPTYYVNDGNGNAYLRFDGGDSLVSALDTSGFTEITMYALSKRDSNTTMYPLSTYQGGAKGLFLTQYDPVTYPFPYNGQGVDGRPDGLAGPTNYLSTLVYDTTAVNHIVAASFGSGTLSAYVDGVASIPITGRGNYAATTTTAVGSPYGAGDFSFGTGNQSEALLFNKVLSSTERQMVDQYLGNKYSVSVVSGSSATSVATQSQIQNLSLQGNVTINAKNDITVGKLNGGVLNMQGTSSLTLKADSDNNGTGAVSMVNSSDVLRTEGRAINITAGSGISISALNTSGATGTQTGGTITLNSDFDANNSGNLSIASTLTTSNGNIMLKGPQVDINGVVNANGADVSVLPTTAKNIRLGGVIDDADDLTYLDLSNPELLRIKANHLTVGDATLASDITLAGNLDLSGRQGIDGGAYNLTLNTLGNFDASGYQMHLGRDALWFDGINDFVSIPINSPETNFTYELWFNTLDPNASLSSVRDPDLGVANDRGLFLYNGKIAHRVWSEETAFSSSNNYSNGMWHQAVVTVENGIGQKVYVDGILVASGTKSASDFNWDSKINIGYNNALYYDIPTAQYIILPNGFIGQKLIDNINLYNTVFTPTQIQAQYNNGLGLTINTPQTNLLGSWNFNQGVGLSSSDASGNGGTGTLVNGPTWVRAKDLTVNTGGNITLGKTLSEGGNVTLNAGGNVNLNGLVGLTGDGNLSITSTGLNKAITVNNAVTANVINIATSGSGSDINLASTLTATGSGNAIVLNSADDINNSYGVGVLTTSNGRWLTNTYERADLINMPLEAFKRYNCVYGGSCPASYPGSGNGTLFRIAPVLTVTADNKTRAYGDANPSLTGSITGYIDGDTDTVLNGSGSYSTTATNTSNVGSYVITSGLGTLSDTLGYQFTAPVDGILTVAKATLQVNIDDKTRAYQSSNPIFTASITGFKLGQDSSILDILPTYSSNANASSLAGRYSITGSGGSDSNYNFAYINGELTIEGISEPEVVPFISNPIQNFGVTRGSNDIIYSSEKTEDSSDPNELFIPEIDTSAVENNSNTNTQIDLTELN